MKSPLAVLAACFAAGISAAHVINLDATGFTACLTAASACLLAGCVLLRIGRRGASFALVLTGFIAAGAAAGRLFDQRFPPNHVSHLEARGVDLSDPVRLEGRIVTTPFRTSYGLQFDIEAQRIESRRQAHEITGRIRLRLQNYEQAEAAGIAGPLSLQYGDSIRALTRLRRPRIYRNPGSFDYRSWMESIHDIYWIGTIKNPLLVEKMPASGFPTLGFLLERVRQRLLHAIDEIYLPWSAEGRYGAVLKAVLLGDRSSLDSETIEGFRKTGLYHLLVIAGLHVGLLALLVGLFLRPFPLSPSTKSVLVMCFLFAYAALVEQRAATLRATLMISLYLLARLLYREHSVLNAVGFAALILLVYRPAWLFDSGFQLSFAAALLIAGLALPILERTTEPYRRALRQLSDEQMDDRLAPKQAQFRLTLRSLVKRSRQALPFLDHHPACAEAAVVWPTRLLVWTANMLLFSAVLQLGLLLPMAETFHRVTFVGVGLNALAIPLMTLLLGLALPIVLLAVFAPAIALWPAKLLTLVLAGILSLTHLPSLPEWLSYRVPEPPLWVAAGVLLSILLAAFTLGRRKRVFQASLLGASFFILLLSVHPFAPGLPRGVLEVTALDCGRGDSLFVILPDGTTMLIDGGGSVVRAAQEGSFHERRWDPGEDVVSPYLWSLGVGKIDILVLSHAHEDHIGGLGAIVRNFRIREFWHGKNPLTPEYTALLDALRERHIPTRELTAGEVLARGGAQVQILWPPSGRPVSRVPSNDDSLVMRISYRSASVLLPGDISSDVECQLMAAGVPLASQVLKVAHHGSKSSSSAAFIARVSPHVALITSELSGSGSLPSPRTMEVLRAAGARIFRTDIDGATSVEMNGSSSDLHIYRASSGDSAGALSSSPSGPVTLSVQ